jgi:hypothetical protein
LWLTYALIAGAVTLAVLVALGQRGRGSLIAAGALAVPGLILAGQEWADRGLEAQLSEITAAIAGRPAAVDCERAAASWIDTSNEWGFVPWGRDGRPAGEVHLDHTACRNLADYLDSEKVGPSVEQVAAVTVVAHEAFHIAGVKNEAETECYAVQRGAMVARLLGATAAQAEVLAQRYWREVYPRLHSDYRSSVCRDGGPWDVAPDTPGWP